MLKLLCSSQYLVFFLELTNMKQLHHFSPSSDFFLLKKGMFNGLHFRLGHTYKSFPEVEYAITYAHTEDDNAEFLVTLSKKDTDSTTQTLTFFSKDNIDCRILFCSPSIESFLEIAHNWVLQISQQPEHQWDPPLQHYPKVLTSQKSEFGTIGPYRYIFHINAQTEEEKLLFVLTCYSPQEKSPTLVLYIEDDSKEEHEIHLFHRNEHITSVGSTNNTTPLKALLRIAEERFSTSFSPPEEKFSVPILKLSLDEINTVLHVEKIYEHSILIIALALLGNTLYTLTSLPYIGWLFVMISGFCWLATSIHGIFAMSAIFNNLAIRIPVCTLYLLPFFFPVYGPTILLFIILTTPFLLRRIITAKEIKLSGSNIQEDDKLLLTARKMLLKKDSKKNRD